MTPNTPPDSITILAGWGIYPFLLAKGARAAGVRRISMIGFKGSTCRATLKTADDVRMIPFGNLESLRKAIAECPGPHILLAGQINPMCFFRSHIDAGMKNEIASIKIRNAHTLFKRLVDFIEEQGRSVLPSSLFMADHIPGPGPLTKRAPDAREADDIAFGNRIAMEIANLDIGQSVVVKDGVVLAVEGFDGTNAAIAHGGAIAKRGAVLAKVAKENHDMRFDIPVIGAKTIARMRKAGLSAMSVQAGRALVLDLPGTINLANKFSISITAVETTLPQAPVCKQPKQLKGV